jgi:dienelactone hydrolase
MRPCPSWPSIGGALMLCVALRTAPLAADQATQAAAAATTELPSQPPPEFFPALSFAATLTLPARAAATPHPPPAVVIAHDRLGPDTRAEPYAAQLAAAGIAVLELLSEDADAGALDRAADALARDARIDGRRLGVLGFGAGGLAAAHAAAPFRARALLYPGCAALADAVPGAAGPAAPPGWAPGTALLLGHGGADAANPRAACEAFGAAMRRHGVAVRRIEYDGAGYAWDRPAFGAQAPRALLPAPDGRGRVPAMPWPALAGLSATQVAGFFAHALA